jgi:carbonic anhydrase
VGAADAAHDEAVRRHAAATAATLRADPRLSVRIARGDLAVRDAVYRMSSGRIDGLEAPAAV